MTTELRAPAAVCEAAPPAGRKDQICREGCRAGAGRDQAIAAIRTRISKARHGLRLHGAEGDDPAADPFRDVDSRPVIPRLDAMYLETHKLAQPFSCSR
jgi:hypothetical protein